MDLLAKLEPNDLVDRKGFSFFVDTEYENLPQYYSHCKMIGH